MTEAILGELPPSGAVAPVCVPVRDDVMRVEFSSAPLPPLDYGRPAWRGRRVHSGGLRLHVRHTPGPSRKAPMAVYLHGLGGSATTWTDLAGQLSVTLRGMALDLPGFGRTAPLADHDFSLRAHTEAVRRFLSGLSARPVHLIGNSFGGAIALRIAAEHPELVRTLTVISPAMPDLRPDLRRMPDPRLVLSNLALLPGMSDWAFGQQLLAMTPRERAERMVRMCFADPSAISEQRLADVAREYAELGRKPWTGNAIGRTTMGLIRHWFLPPPLSMWQDLPRIIAPTLVVWGADDRLVTVRKAPRTAAGIARARLLVLPRTGHIAQMERPATVARAILGMLEATAAGRW